jgi:ZIP family zinc transporter
MLGWLEAALWGLVGGGALVIGAAIAWVVQVPSRVVATVMAFGAGVLISTLAFELMDEAEASGGLTTTALGFLLGAGVYVAANAALARRGAQHRKRSGDQQPSQQETGSGTALALGALLDGVPESVVLGASLLGGGGIGAAVLTAVFISNVPEGLSSAAGMKKAGRPARYVFAVWGGIALASAISAAIGYATLQGAAPQVLAAITAIAAGAILAMVADTMIPEAFEQAHLGTGLVTAFGFLTAFSIDRVG